MKFKILAVVLILAFFVGCEDEGPEPVPPYPVVEITSLPNLGGVIDTTLVVINATDDKGVIRVELYLNNTLDSSRVFFQPPYIWPWSVRNLPDSSLHTLFARAYDADGHISTSPVITARVLRLQPNSLHLSFVNDTAAILTWNDPSSIETGFEIERSLDGVNFQRVQTVEKDVNYAVLLDSFYNDSTYFFRVRSYRGNLKSEYTNTVSDTIDFSPPGNVRITNMTEDIYTLEWDDLHDFELGFYLEQSSDGGHVWTRIKKLPANTKKVEVQNVYLTSKVYAYRVQAFSNINLSRYSNVVASALVFPAPDNLVVLGIDDRSIRLRWRDNSSFGSVFECKFIDNTGYEWVKTTVRDSLATSVSFAYRRDRQYKFQVRAVANHSESDYSNQVLVYFKDELYAGGNYSASGSTVLKNLAKWDGTDWIPFGSGFDEPITSLRRYYERIFIGGKKLMTAWDGKSFFQVGTLTGANDYIYSMTDTNGQLVAGGVYSHLQGSLNGIGRWRGSQWEALGGGMNGPVYAVTFYNNEFYAGGNFTTAGNGYSKNITRWNNGSRWLEVAGGLSGSVNALAEYNGELYSGGGFRDTTNGFSYIAKWKANTTEDYWHPVGTGVIGNPLDSFSVNSLIVFDNELYAAGKFTSIGGVPAFNIARWNGLRWAPVGLGIGGEVKNMFIFDDNLYVCGKFSYAGSVSANNIAKWDGTDWSPLASGLTGTNAVVYSMGQFGSWYWTPVK